MGAAGRGRAAVTGSSALKYLGPRVPRAGLFASRCVGCSVGGRGSENPQLGVCNSHNGREGRAPRRAQSLCCYPLEVTVPLFLSCQPRTASLGPKVGILAAVCLSTSVGQVADTTQTPPKILQQVLSVTAQETRVQVRGQGRSWLSPSEGHREAA